MFHQIVDGAGSGVSTNDDGAIEAATLLASFETALAAAVETTGTDRIRAETPLDETAVDAVAAGDVGSLTLEEGVAVLAARDGSDPAPMVAELRDHLLMGMATAVLDVDTVAASIDADLTGQEVQQTLEGRAEMTLEQLAEVMAVIESRKP
ncbi:MAG: DUF5791 family protein [Halorubrum sp.]